MKYCIFKNTCGTYDCCSDCAKKCDDMCKDDQEKCKYVAAKPKTEVTIEDLKRKFGIAKNKK